MKIKWRQFESNRTFECQLKIAARHGLQLQKKWKLGLTARYEKLRFALNGEGASSGGIGEERSLPLLLSIDYTPWPMTSVSALIGAELNGHLRLEDSRGDRLAGTDFDTAPVIGLAFSSRF